MLVLLKKNKRIRKRKQRVYVVCVIVLSVFPLSTSSLSFKF